MTGLPSGPAQPDPLAGLADHPCSSEALVRPWRFRWSASTGWCGPVLARRADSIAGLDIPRPDTDDPADWREFAAERLASQPPLDEEVFSGLVELMAAAEACQAGICDCHLRWWHQVAIRRADRLLEATGPRVWAVDVAGVEAATVDGWLTVGGLHASLLAYAGGDDRIVSFTAAWDGRKVIARFVDADGLRPRLQARPLPAPVEEAWRLAGPGASAVALAGEDQLLVTVAAGLARSALSVGQQQGSAPRLLDDLLASARRAGLGSETQEVREVAAGLAATWEGDVTDLLDAARRACRDR